MSGMIAVEEALARVLASAGTPLDEERVGLDAARGRVLARGLAALRTQPPFANSAVDGYALRAADAASGSATLTVIGESAAASVRARRSGSSPGRRCRTAPTRSSFRRTSGARATASRSRRRRREAT